MFPEKLKQQIRTDKLGINTQNYFLEISNIIYQSRVVNSLMNENERMNCVLVFYAKKPTVIEPVSQHHRQSVWCTLAR